MPDKPKPKYCEEVLKTLNEIEVKCQVVIEKGNGGRKLAESICGLLCVMRARNIKLLNEGECDGNT